MGQELLEKSAFELADLIRSKKVTPFEVVQTHVQKARIENPDLNAIVEDRYDLALDEAKAKTEQLTKLAESEIPCLFGVPFTIKEMIALEGFKRTAGNIHRRNQRSSFNATVVQRIRNAGAIPLGTTNVPELGFWFESDNPVYGRTKNPFDLKRTAGGSSGGEGSIVGSGASPFGLGSDIGGSIRMPAFFCGVAGHKPSNRIVPNTGHFPYEEKSFLEIDPQFYPYTTIGILSRRAKDLHPLMNLIIGADSLDPFVKKDFHLLPETSKFHGKKVFILPEPRIHLSNAASSELSDCVVKAAQTFEAAGAIVQEFPADFFNDGVNLWAAALKKSKNSSFSANLSPEKKLNLPKELFKLSIGQADYSLPALITVLLEKSLADEHKLNQAIQDLEILKQKFSEILGEDGILILPPHPRVAPKHRAPLFSPFDYIYAGIFNVMGVPATCVSMGLNAQHIPLGVQIVSGLYKDHMTLSAASFLEEKFGGWSLPSR